MVSTETGESRLLLVGDPSDGAPVDGVMTPDGNRILLLVAEPVGRAPDITTRWKVVELDVGDGSVRETGIRGDFDAPTGALAVDFADDAGSFVLWDRTSDAATLVNLRDRSQTAVAATPDHNGTLGWRAFSGGAARMGADGEITLVDSAGATIQVLREHEAPVMDVVVAPDGTWAASASDGLPDGELYRWDVDPGTGLWSSPEALSGHSGAVVDVEVDGTGQRLVSTSGDTTAISWRMGADAGTAGVARSMDAAELLATACAIVGRDLTEDEWERYLPDEPFTPTCTDLAPR
jgi:WD40 repeat protein